MKGPKGSDSPYWGLWKEIIIPPVPEMNLRTNISKPELENLLPPFLGPKQGANPLYWREMEDLKEAKIEREIDHYAALFRIEMLEKMVNATNAYGRKYIKGWCRKDGSFNDTCVQELGGLIGIVLMLGIIKYPSRADVWDQGIYGNEYIQNVMTYRRFNDLLRAWHYEDVTSLSKEELRDLKTADPFWAVRGFIDDSSAIYEQAYNTSRHVDIDEQCIPWKGRHKCRVYNSDKPEPWHWKMFSLNCGSTGYCKKIYPYMGAAELRPAGMAASFFPYYNLFLTNAQFHNCNYILYTDNWFTSVNAVEAVLSTGIISSTTDLSIPDITVSFAG